jgi:glycerol-3-phosphate dehydrogenase (NAD(P)+)
MSDRQTIAVLGAGNWGTTLAHLVASNGRRVRLWTRDRARALEINEQRTSASVPGLRIAGGVHAATALGEVVRDAGLVLIVLPSQAFRGVCRDLGDCSSPDQLVVHCSKGLELGTHRRMSEILFEETSARQIGVLSGPNIAAEIAQGKPAGTVIASAFPEIVRLMRELLSSPTLRVFSSTDVIGVELCGALKNVVAIAAGMADEMQLGDNAKAFLITRGMAELMRLASALGAEPLTLTGLAGIGDLMVTCQSPLSRNHRIGVALARGQRLDAAVSQLGMVAEGVYASRAARALAAAREIELPLFTSVDRVLHEGLAPAAALGELMRLAAGRDVALSWSVPRGSSR